jgi:PRTRC genetic system protein C
MAVKSTTIATQYELNGTILAAPEGASAEEVRQLYAAAKPEIINAACKPPEQIGDKLVVRFVAGVGQKG